MYIQICWLSPKCYCVEFVLGPITEAIATYLKLANSEAGALQTASTARAECDLTFRGQMQMLAQTQHGHAELFASVHRVRICMRV